MHCNALKFHKPAAKGKPANLWHTDRHSHTHTHAELTAVPRPAWHEMVHVCYIRLSFWGSSKKDIKKKKIEKAKGIIEK